MIPVFEKLPLRCGKCGADWEDWAPQYCPVETWVAHVKTFRCPVCGDRKQVLLVVKPREAA